MKIESLDCEIAVYRKGFLSVRIDLNRGIIVWNDSNRWCNNFLRTLAPDQLEWLNHYLPQATLLQVLPLTSPTCQVEIGRTQGDGPDATGDVPDVPGNHRLAWSIVLRTSEGCHEENGYDTLPAGWSQLVKMIESISRASFRL
jgi:hypothetical protein